ncbi:MAG TPA: polysaccharide deacetylase family protein, partial [Terriglobales bacterium]|nr:polysaccharide deacetylase family protein [Terriglobales bacterium]
NWHRRWRGRYPVLILTHHLITDRIHRMGTSTETFWCQVRFLQRHYRIIGLSEGIELLRSGEVKVPCVALTFDDGYGDNFVSLRAVAEETAIPVALFLPTQPIENHQEFQHDLVKGISGFFPLTWDQVRYWNLRGGEFGSHTHTHFDCGYADRKRLEAEIIGSKNILESHLTKPVRFFAFPFGGQRNISSKAMQLAAFTYPHVLSDFGGENLPDIGRSKGHLFRKNFYSNLWELELELQSVFDLVAARQKFSLGRANSSSSPNRLIGASAFNTRRNASSSSSRIDASRHHGSPVQ